jgi:hypothetical protein
MQPGTWDGPDALARLQMQSDVRRVRARMGKVFGTPATTSGMTCNIPRKWRLLRPISYARDLRNICSQ